MKIKGVSVKQLLSIVAMGAMALSLMTGCGNEIPDDADVSARNLKTGDIKTFSAESDVPDGYALCADEDCAVPSEVPCELLGAEVCQYQPNCRIKVISCTSGGIEVPMGCAEPGTAPEGPDGTEPKKEDPTGCLLPDEAEVCQVACISKDFQLCSEIFDPALCASRPECDWLNVDCLMMCECPDNGMPCECPPCAPNAGQCVERPPLSCGQITNQQACLANKGCGWGEVNCFTCTCACACPAGDETCECPPCDCEEQCEFGCYDLPESRCEGLDSEPACLSNPECEWGQFECPPCIMDSPSDGSGESMPYPCDCGLSCRTRQHECPPVPMIGMECPPDQHAEPIYDEMRCLIGWQCTSQPICPPLPMYYMACEDGTAPTPIFDDLGCQIGWDCATLGCNSDEACPPGLFCVFTGSGGPAQPGTLEGRCQPCAPVLCEMYCPGGFARDQNGCEICVCDAPVPPGQ